MSKFQALKKKTEKEPSINPSNFNFLCDTKYCRVHTACLVTEGTFGNCEILEFMVWDQTQI